jgi:poly-gamma-glutamate system protein
MKKIYWKAHNLPRYFILSLSAVALLGMTLVEMNKKFVPQKYYKEKIAAAELAHQAFSEIRLMRQRLGIPINLGDDPQQSGLIGKQLTDITTDQGVLVSKQTSVNPNIAAIFVDWLKQFNLKKGDLVAVGATGSFPALDISMLAAIKTLGLKPLIIYSVGASQYGANIPGFTWLDMEERLKQARLFDYEPLAVSLGGSRDVARGMAPEGQAILMSAITRYHFNYLDPQGTIDSINKRLELYKKAAGNQPIKAYINIGGNMASIGLKRAPNALNKTPAAFNQPHSLRTGPVRSMPIELVNTDSVAVRFLKEGIPVINIRNIAQKLRDEYNLPRNPKFSPTIGTGAIFAHKIYNRWLASLALSTTLAVLVVMAMVSRKYRIRFIRSK